MVRKTSASSPSEFNMVNGVKNDFSLLLHRFVETNSVRYEHFAEIWRSMKMPLLFAGRQNDQEVREFTEECMAIAVTYVMPPNVFQEKVGGLFLLYGLYYKQLFKPKVKIRVTMPQWMELQALMTEVRAQNHYDIEYVFLKLQHDNAFHFVANPTIQTMVKESGEENQEKANKPQEGQLELDRLQQKHSLISEIVEGDAIDQLSGIHDQYHRIKCTLSGPEAQVPQTSLNMIEPNIVQFITKKIAQFEWWKKFRAGKRISRRRHDSGPTTSESEADSESEKVPLSPKKIRNMGSVRAEIKARAMGTSADVSRSRRHRRVRRIPEVNESFDSSGSPSKGPVKKPEHDSSEDEYNTSKSLNESQETTSSDHAEGILSMPALRYLEEPKRSRKKRKGTVEGAREKPKQRKRLSKNKGANPHLDSSHEGHDGQIANMKKENEHPLDSLRKGRKSKGKGKGKGKSEVSDKEEETPVLDSSLERKTASRKRKTAVKEVKEVDDGEMEIVETRGNKRRRTTTKAAELSLNSSVSHDSEMPDLSLTSSSVGNDSSTKESETVFTVTAPVIKRPRGRPRKIPK